MEPDLFEKVKTGEITSTKNFRIKSIRPDTDDWKKDQTFWALLDLIEAGHIEGTRSLNDADGNYDNLTATKRGIKFYNFLNTPIDQLGKATFIESCKNGIISAFPGKIVWWFVAFIIILLFTSLKEKAEAVLTLIINWLFA